MQRLLTLLVFVAPAAAFKPSSKDELRQALETCDYQSNCEKDGIPIAQWDVSEITDMEMLFRNTPFNGDISAWDVSAVTNMREMFYEAFDFNGDISAWDVSAVTDMYAMFGDANDFNQQLCGQAWIDTNADTNMMFADSGGGAISDVACTLCAAGKFKDNTGTCQPCQVGVGGTYSERAGQTICLTCPTQTPFSYGTGCIILDSDALATAVRADSTAYQKAGLCP